MLLNRHSLFYFFYDFRFFTKEFGRDQQRYIFTQDLFGRIPEKDFCTPVPAGNDPIQCFTYNGIIGGSVK